MEDLGFMIEATWKVAICTRCKFVVDKAVLIDHLKQKHGLDNSIEDAILQVARQYALRPHLAIIWDEIAENQLAVQIMDNFNSSGIEFEPAVSKNSGRRPGRASIAQIIEASDIEGLTSKRTVKQLQFEHGSPSTRAQQQLWAERFNAFQTKTLKSLSVPFTGDDVLRYFDSIIGKLRMDFASSQMEPSRTQRARAMNLRNMTAAAYRRSSTMLSETNDSREAYGFDESG
ncbi:hypothetical protein V1527DRAFT_482434 [Lipomyces starkeyi]